MRGIPQLIPAHVARVRHWGRLEGLAAHNDTQFGFDGELFGPLAIATLSTRKISARL
ncbi:Uncharacterised protein [Mycobacteroides abscessus subsp. massiliense]|nr:Uncharacterised protein [Mycobacteroides abscessus subsp. massiliense]